MRFSVLVPVYNVEEYLEQCLESLLNQQYDNYEVILVDDGSTDKSGEICDKYAKEYPQIFRVVHKKNQGLISARREGIKIAESEFCVFVDSDDFVEHSLLKTVSEYLEKDNEFDILIYSFRYYRNGRIAERFKKVTNDGYIWDESNKKELYDIFISSMAFASIWTKVIRTSILQSDNTDYTQYYSKNMSEDILQSIYPLTVARKIMYTDKVLYNYRINDESISRSFYPSTIKNKNTLHVYNEIRRYLPKWDMDCSEIHKKLKARWFNDFMYMMSKYYECARNKKERREILEYDWDTMLPDDAYDPNNPYENEAYKKIYFWLKNKNTKTIWWYFLKKKWYQKIRKWKRNVLTKIRK